MRNNVKLCAFYAATLLVKKLRLVLNKKLTNHDFWLFLRLRNDSLGDKMDFSCDLLHIVQPAICSYW